MDGTTEPIVAVFGHPIAGNPSQFALERALVALDLDWRVLSFQVAPDQIPKALDGAEVLGIRGLILDPTLAQAAAAWNDRRQTEGEQPPGHVDCFCFQSGQLEATWQEKENLGKILRRHIETFEPASVERLWLGGLPEGDDESNLIGKEMFDDPTPLLEAPDAEDLASAKLIVVSGAADQPAILEVDDWPQGDPGRMVVDITADGRPEMNAIRELGYRTITIDDRRAHTLAGCLETWSEHPVQFEVIQEAIEEYFAV